MRCDEKESREKVGEKLISEVKIHKHGLKRHHPMVAITQHPESNIVYIQDTIMS